MFQKNEFEQTTTPTQFLTTVNSAAQPVKIMTVVKQVS